MIHKINLFKQSTISSLHKSLTVALSAMALYMHTACRECYKNTDTDSLIYSIIEVGMDRDRDRNEYPELRTPPFIDHIKKIVRGRPSSQLINNLYHRALADGYIVLVAPLIANWSDQIRVKKGDLIPGPCLFVSATIDTVKFLIKKGAKVNIWKNGRTPLHDAVVYAPFDVLEYLVKEKRAHVNASKKENCEIPLFKICKGKEFDKRMKLLLEAGATIKGVYTCFGENALQFTIRQDSIAMFKCLIEEHGLSPEIETRHFLTTRESIVDKGGEFLQYCIDKRLITQEQKEEVGRSLSERCWIDPAQAKR